jgi:hypothetical protein
MSNKYVLLRRLEDAGARRRAARRLIELRQDLKPICERKKDTSLLLATWNIRDFDSNKFRHGPRLPETFFYIAEIISAFDLVAVQEVARDLGALERVMDILGREWDYIVTDTSARESGGNDERLAFLYNTEKVWFRKVAGEIVLPRGQTIVPPEAKAKSKQGGAGEPPPPAEGLQFARTPFLVAFQSGWFRFSLCTVHIYYGKPSGPELRRRIGEIEALAKFFAERQDKDSKQEKDRLGVVENYILLGDFNVVSPEHETMRALTEQKFVVPPEIADRDELEAGKHFYDQIAVRVKDPRFKVKGGGIYDMYRAVFRDDDEDFAAYKPLMPNKDPEGRMKNRRNYYGKWRTWQMSDHNPLWIEIETDFADDYLGALTR